MDPSYPEKVIAKFIPHLDKIAADARDQAKDLALLHYTETDTAKKAEIGNKLEQLLARARTYSAIKSNVLADPLLDKDALQSLMQPPATVQAQTVFAGPPAAAVVVSPGDSVAGARAA